MDTLTLIDSSRLGSGPAQRRHEFARRCFDSVLCFGDSDWWYHNRGHADMQFMRRFARRCKVIYVNSLGVRPPTLGEGTMFARRLLRKSASFARYYQDSTEGFKVLSPLYAPLEGWTGRMMQSALVLQIRTVLRLARMQRPLLWIACPSAAPLRDRLPSAGIVYQLSDYYADLKSQRNSRAEQWEQDLAARADLVLCSSEQLLHRARTLYGKGEYVDHGVDFNLFNGAIGGPVPAELESLPRPIIGFFGNIDGNTVDRNLLEEIIQLRPHYAFVLVGPMAGDFQCLRRHPNLHWVPQKPYRKIPAYGAAFDVCIMPWLDNLWIKHCNPIKLKEYLALAKPVVSTPFPELRHTADLCYAARGADAFCHAIDRALAEDNDERRQRRARWASQHTWDSKFDLLMRHLNERGFDLHH